VFEVGKFPKGLGRHIQPQAQSNIMSSIITGQRNKPCSGKLLKSLSLFILSLLGGYSVVLPVSGGERIAFVVSSGKTSQIYSMLPTGRDLKPLSFSKSDFYPVVSPKRDKIVFLSKRDGPTFIYVMDARGKNVKNLSANKVGDASVIHGSPPFISWLSDSQIVFWSERRGVNSGIYRCNIESGHISLVTKGADCPVGSPDGGRIAFINGVPKNPDPWVGMTLAVIGSQGENQFDLSAKPRTSYSRPYWSPDGEEILYVEHDSLGGTKIKLQRPFPASTPVEIYHSSVQWDSTRQNEEVLCLAWSPKGKYLAFSTAIRQNQIKLNEELIWRTVSRNLYLFDKDRKITTKLLDKKEIANIAWSPREGEIAVTIMRGKKGRIASMNIFSGKLIYLTPSSLDCWDPQWVVTDE
jgi:dipeptidyl aminopeptidase/acylaminoacyl peptidase